LYAVLIKNYLAKQKIKRSSKNKIESFNDFFSEGKEKITLRCPLIMINLRKNCQKLQVLIFFARVDLLLTKFIAKKSGNSCYLHLKKLVCEKVSNLIAFNSF